MDENTVSTHKIIDKNLESVMHEAMMPYAEYVIMDRAIPRLEDGLKPVQRRVLYAMYELGNTPDKPYKKCARIVGECLGKFHPHGDTSVYDALARLAQDFNMGEILVDGQGNFGSADGDKPAAMRYTEARLAPLALEMLRDLDKNTVPFSANFDNTQKEPALLPGRFPNLLVNGASGIAIGLATSIPTHNLGEVIDGTIAYIESLIKKKPLSLDEIMQYIPAPDFSTGGEIIPLQIRQAYETGKGKILIRAKFKIEREGEKRNIVFTEFPYQTNKQDIVKKILEDKEKGKEAFDPISDVVDESDREGIRVVVKLVKNANIGAVLRALYKYSDLAKSFSFNMVAIAGGKPKLLSLISILDHYAKYQRDLIKKRSEFDLSKAKERAEILGGLLIAINNIDEVIKIIKKARTTSDAKSTLRVRFSLSEKQANAILEMQLRRLTSLEIDDLKNEIAALTKLIADLTAIVGSETRQYRVVIDELKEIRRKYGSPRRSFISSNEDEVIDAAVNAISTTSQGYLLTRANGTVVFVKNSSFGTSNREASAFDSASAVVDVQPCKNDTVLYAFTDKGNYVRVYTDSIGCSRMRDKGFSARALSPQAKADEKIVKAFTVVEGEEDSITIAHFTSSGNVRYCKLSEYVDEKIEYAPAVKLKNGEERVIAVEIVTSDKIVMISKKGYGVKVDGSDVMVKGKLTLGSSVMKVGDDDQAIFAAFMKDDEELILVGSSGHGKRMTVSNIPELNKNCRGSTVLAGLIYAAKCVRDDSLIINNADKGLRFVALKDVILEDIYDKGDYLLDELGYKIDSVTIHKIS
ncbi:MAG: DNA topoisomerase 4 subunit A [Clostridia bacterium]|nr:DNA topoisomerase 4 subunit A [Clostridia bacterium]